MHSVHSKITNWAYEYGKKHGYKGHKYIVNGLQEPLFIDFKDDTDEYVHHIYIKMVGKKVIYGYNCGVVWGNHYPIVELELNDEILTVNCKGRGSV